jgi:DeoR family transcriptional regulator of aga operon
VDDEGFASVQELSERFGVSTVTVRADLDHLQAAGGLQRVRGGAVRRSRPEKPFEQTSAEAGPAKARIAARAVDEVHDGDTLLLDVGTTTTAIARELVARRERHGLTVFTNSLTIAFELEHAADRIDVVVTGGTLRPLQHSLVDPLATVLLAGISAHMAFIGCNGVDAAAGVTNVNLPETTVKRAFLRAARRRVVVADASKLGAVQLARICGLDEVDLLITDAAADATALEALRAADLDIALAPRPPDPPGGPT